MDDQRRNGEGGDDALHARFVALRRSFEAERYPPASVRIDRLRRLDGALRAKRMALADAVSDDFGHRSIDETLLFELFPTHEAIGHARRHVRRWMRPERRRTSMWFLPGRAAVVTQPVGVVGIVVPWNYPLFLALSPLAGALAAGNRVMLKVSEFTPRTGAALAAMLREAFSPEEVCVVEGDVQVAKAFAALPFDHLLFTGSTAVGRDVMASAARNLTPVTLELGGKSPAIVGPGFAIERAAERIIVGKCMNAGQTCIAPDYAMVPEGAVDAFVRAARSQVARLYPSLPASSDYSSIINERQFDRLRSLVDDALARGASVVPLAPGEPDRAKRSFPPVAIVGAPADAAVMREEIFGPILPVVPYASVDDAIAYVNARPHPLALYYFDDDPGRVRRLLETTLAGGVTINDTILHIAQESLPFGGVGPSGMGRYHGHAGYLAFSNSKGVFRQSRLNGIGLFKPPYGPRFRALLALLLR